MGRLIVRQLPDRIQRPVITLETSGTTTERNLVVGRSQDANLILDLSEWRRPNTVSREMLEFRIGVGGASVTSRRTRGVLPVLWQQSETSGQWIILGVIVRRFEFGPGRYQVVAAGQGSDICYVEVDVYGVPVPDPTQNPDYEPLLCEGPSARLPELESKWDYLVVIYGLLARLRCAPTSDASIRSAMLNLHAQYPFAEAPGAQVVKAFKDQAVKPKLDVDQSVAAFLRDLPYGEINDEIRHHQALPRIIEELPRLVSPDCLPRLSPPLPRPKLS